MHISSHICYTIKYIIYKCRKKKRKEAEIFKLSIIRYRKKNEMKRICDHRVVIADKFVFSLKN
jgi:hypothetical protein